MKKRKIQRFTQELDDEIIKAIAECKKLHGKTDEDDKIDWNEILKNHISYSLIIIYLQIRLQIIN